MNPLAFLSPYRWLAAGLLVMALLAGVYALDRSRQAIGYSKAKAECQAAADKANAEAQARHDLQTAASASASATYETARQQWEKTLNANRKSLYAATQNLASCRLDSLAIGLLNDAANGKANGD